MFQQPSNMGHVQENDSLVLRTFWAIALPEGKA